MADCKPCSERGRKGVPATRMLDGEPWCEECYAPDTPSGTRQRREAEQAARQLRHTGWFGEKRA